MYNLGVFYLQFRNAPDDSYLMEYSSAWPLPAPARGDEVALFAPDGNSAIRGKVDRIEHGYQPEPAAPSEAVGSLGVYIRVWLQLA